MEGIFMGKIVGSCSHISEEDGKRCASIYFHDTESNACSKLSHYNKTYSLVLSDDVIETNDEILKLRDEVKRLTEACNGWEAECNDWKARYAKGNNELFQKGLAYGTLETTYKNEKIAGELLLKDRDMWKRRWNSVVTDIGESLKANGITFVLKEIHGDGNWNVVIDIPELNEAKKKVEDLEKKLKAAESKESYWRDRKEEEEDHHHYWCNTFRAAEKKAFEAGVCIHILGEDRDINTGKISVQNKKAEELESQVAQMEDANQKLRQRISSADEEVDKVDKYWQRRYDDLAECWTNTHKDIVAVGKKVGVKIDIQGKKSDSNTCPVYITNEKALELMVNVSNTKHEYNKKWQAMLNALKAKGVEVIYMGEADEKPVIDVKIPAIDILKKELDDLKSRTLDNVEIRLSCGDIVWTYCDGFVHVSSGIISSDEIDTRHINCLCKNYVDAESISCGTVPKCKTCKNHQYFTNGGHLCHRPDSKYKIPGMFHIKYLTEEEAEGPACADFEAREEADCKDCKHHETAFWKVSIDREGMAVCRSPKTKYGFCRNNCNGEKACPEFEKKE